ncbi:hypothetical protein GCM10008992_28710 [Halorubrum aquaticum]
MYCTTCESFLALHGDDRAGIRAVEANYGTETARVVYDPEEIERKELPEALSGYGYTLGFRDGTPTDDDGREHVRTDAHARSVSNVRQWPSTTRGRTSAAACGRPPASIGTRDCISSSSDGSAPVAMSGFGPER